MEPMLTDDEKRELIARLRDEDEIYEASMWDAIALAREAADALEGTITESEWEYGYTRGSADPLTVCKDRETAQACARAMKERVVRRRKAGPWTGVSDALD